MRGFPCGLMPACDRLSWSDTTLELAGSWNETREDWEVCSPFSRQIITSDKMMTWEDARYYYYYYYIIYILSSKTKIIVDTAVKNSAGLNSGIRTHLWRRLPSIHTSGANPGLYRTVTASGPQ